MTALSAAARRATRQRHLVSRGSYPVGTAAVIYQNGLVALNVTSKRAVAASSVASRRFLGLATETRTGNTGGTVRVEVEYGHEALFAAGTGLTSGMVDSEAWVKDDNTVTYQTGAGTAALRVSVGMITEFASATTCWVWLRQSARIATGVASG